MQVVNQSTDVSKNAQKVELGEIALYKLEALLGIGGQTFGSKHI